MKPKRVTVTSLIDDPSFRQWVLSPTSTDITKWQRWMKTHPEYHNQVQEAKELLLNIRPKDNPTADQAEIRVWTNIRDGIAEPADVVDHSYRVVKFPVWKVAASIVLALASSVLLYLWLASPSYVSVSTAYEEVQEFMLPDSSWVVLNANSSLRYPKSWDPTADRQVWLVGEAFFKVKKRSSSSSQVPIKFTVHTNPLEVEVLGTEFSVNHRRQETQIVLNEGKVRVIDTQREEGITLKPGEMVNYTGQAMLLSQVDATTKTSWKEELIIFKDESLIGIFSRLEDTYGYSIEVVDEEILERRFSGSYPRDSVQVLFEKLEKLYQLTITKNEKKIIIRK
ncbi:MAG: FecR domain-containing protein [Tunicatimonas sp.]|uniref:FecR family protein n=1 Tax=Tunicatimonas sp. TaxID=1940096 RepID=UPI003C734622